MKKLQELIHNVGLEISELSWALERIKQNQKRSEEGYA